MAKPLYKTNNTKKLHVKGEKTVEGIVFEYEYFLLPLIGLDAKEQTDAHEYIINKLGTREKNGVSCLDVTEELVRTNIENNEYAGVVFVKNVSNDEWSDEASGTMQYYDWCKSHKSGLQNRSQLWLNDICRITNQIDATKQSGDKPKLSPVKVLMTIFEDIAVKYVGSELKYLHLMVENHEPERTVLPKIYKTYGFSTVDAKQCNVGDDMIVMRKIIKGRMTVSKRNVNTGKHTRKTKSKRNKKIKINYL